jgi:hypothetical protein
MDFNPARELHVGLPLKGYGFTCRISATCDGTAVGSQCWQLVREGEPLFTLDNVKRGVFVRPPRSPERLTYVQVFDTKGRGYRYGPGEIGARLYGRVLGVGVGRPDIRAGRAGNPTGWRLSFAGKQGEKLRVAEYLQSVWRAATLDSTGDHYRIRGSFLHIRGGERDRDYKDGAFAVWEFEADGEGKLVAAAVDFMQYYEKRESPFYGVVRYNSSYQ